VKSPPRALGSGWGPLRRVRWRTLRRRVVFSSDHHALG